MSATRPTGGSGLRARRAMLWGTIVVVSALVMLLPLLVALPRLKYMDALTYRHNHIIPLSWYSADLNNANPVRRGQAARAIELKGYDTDVSSYLASCLRDPDPGVRRVAIRAIVTNRAHLGELTVSDQALVGELLRIVQQDADNDVRLSALNGLLWLRNTALADRSLTSRIDAAAEAARREGWVCGSGAAYQRKLGGLSEAIILPVVDQGAAEDDPVSTAKRVAADFMHVSDSRLSPLASAPGRAAFESVPGDEPAYRLKVNLGRQRVCAVRFTGRVPDQPVGSSLDDREAARNSAAEWGRRLCPENAAEISFQTAVSFPNEDACKFHLFVWQQKQQDAFTGLTLVVRVAPKTHLLQSAVLGLPPRGPLPAVTVSEDDARALAQHAGDAWAGQPVKILAAALYLSHPQAPSGGPAWLVTIQPAQGKWTDYVCIDAHDGSVLFPRPDTPR